MGQVYVGRVMRFFGESLRQAGILILGSALVIWGLFFIGGLTCGIEGAYLLRAQGAPAYAGVFSAWCDLREVIPYAVRLHDGRQGRHRDRRRAGLDADLRRDRRAGGDGRSPDHLPLRDPAARRLDRAAVRLPGRRSAISYFASYLAVVKQIGDTSSGGYLLIFWMFQNPPDLLFSLIKGMVMATVIVLVGCYFGYTASGGPVGVGAATAKSMALNIVLVHIIGMTGTLVFWGANPRAPIGG